jgi:tetratricopeptide (TPR) repeat protein
MRFFTLAALLLCLSSFPALAETPFRADAGLTKAEAQLAEGKYTQGIDTLAAVLARRPADGDALTYTGYAWMKLGDAKKAAEFFDRALKYDPQHLGANAYRAGLYLDAGDFQRAIEQMQALRIACAGTDCPELDALRARMDAFKSGGEKKAE